MSDHQDDSPPKKKNRREACKICCRPQPRACICHALPDQPLVLQDTAVVILQHPHEFKHTSNRSVPLLTLCFSSSNDKSSPLHLCVGRRFGDHIPLTIRELLQPPNLPILIFPETEEDEHLRRNEASRNSHTAQDARLVYSLSEIQARILEWRQEQKRKSGAGSDQKAKPKVVLLVLDATWKFAKEMHRANINGHHYPPDMPSITLQRDDMPEHFQPSRFEIRTTPRTLENGSATTKGAAAWMCTAECVAWILSQLEQKAQPQNSIYETVLRGIDAMVERQQYFIRENQTNPERKKTGADEKPLTTRNDNDELGSDL